MLAHDRLLGAFRRLGDLLDPGDRPVEVLLVGGAAGMLAGYLPSGRTTEDCDVMVCAPPEAWSAVESAAARIALACDLPAGWLSSAAEVFAHRLLPDWVVRRRLILEHERISVYVPHRLDFLAAKILAGRDIDIDDVIEMGMSAREYARLRAAFEDWPMDRLDAEAIPLALERLDALYLKEPVE